MPDMAPGGSAVVISLGNYFGLVCPGMTLDPLPVDIGTNCPSGATIQHHLTMGSQPGDSMTGTVADGYVIHGLGSTNEDLYTLMIFSQPVGIGEVFVARNVS